jgi:hypothetical protein
VGTAAQPEATGVLAFGLESRMVFASMESRVDEWCHTQIAKLLSRHRSPI